MHFILWEKLLDEPKGEELIRVLDAMALSYSIHKIIPFVGELSPEPPLLNNRAICFGPYSMRHYARKYNLTPGVFDLEPFDFSQQKKHWGQEMLNYDSEVVSFKNAAPQQEHFFCRPIEDSKSFAGQIMQKSEFLEWRDKVCLLNDDYGQGTIKPEDLIQLSSLKEIRAEYRTYVVDSKIITASLYKRGNKVFYEEIDSSHEAWQYAQKMANIWQPHTAFCLDVALTSEGYKIVEINTMNSAGFYHCNMGKIVSALLDFYEPIDEPKKILKNSS